MVDSSSTASMVGSVLMCKDTNLTGVCEAPLHCSVSCISPPSLVCSTMPAGTATGGKEYIQVLRELS